VLSADSVVRVQLSVDGEGPLAVAAGDDADLSVDAIRSAEGIASMYVDAEQSVADDVGERLAADDRVDEVERVVEGETTRFRVSVSGTTFPGVVVDNGGSVHSLAVDADGYDATVDVGPSGDASRIVDAVEDRFDRATVRSIRSHERTDSTLTKGHLSTLTEKQRTTLETAYAEGYFESPRERSAEEIADSMSIAGSTFLQHLRTAERKLLGSVISPDEGEPDR
jgi:predicted DNA binding protein